jgi:outer membrane protein OmpA-like peptidoglycan-associated protein
MRGLVFVGMALVACAQNHAYGPAADGPLRAAELAGVRCLLVAPLENVSDLPLAGEAATQALVAEIDPHRVGVFPVAELRAIFRGTPVELPEGIPASLALELAEILGADAALHGAVEGRLTEAESGLFVTLRLARATKRDVLYAATVPVSPSPGEAADAAVRRAVAEASRALMDRLGSSPDGERCFDRSRAARVRAVALGHPLPRVPAQKAPEPSPPSPAVPPSYAIAAPPPILAPAVKPKNPRQADWAKRLAAGERFVVDGLLFDGRSAKIHRDAGLVDLAGALAAAPVASIRLEGFVDATSDAGRDRELSAAMAQAAAQRLVALGVTRDRISWAARGGERPLLPNFTAKGRATNRRVEAVAAK